MGNRRDRRRKEREEVRRGLNLRDGGGTTAPPPPTSATDPRDPDVSRFRVLIAEIERRNHASLGVVGLRGKRGVACVDAPLAPEWFDPERITSAGLTPAATEGSWLSLEPRLTLLSYAARLRRVTCAQALLFAGADPTARWVPQPTTRTPPPTFARGPSLSERDGAQALAVDGAAAAAAAAAAENSQDGGSTADTPTPIVTGGAGVASSAGGEGSVEGQTGHTTGETPQTERWVRAVPIGVAKGVQRLLARYPAAYAVWVLCEVVRMRELGAETLWRLQRGLPASPAPSPIACSSAEDSHTQSTARPSAGRPAQREDNEASAGAGCGIDSAWLCAVCTHPITAPLGWGGACGHLFCEGCLWETMLADEWADQLRCPARGCAHPRPSLTPEQLASAAAAAKDPTPDESRARFETLPETLGAEARVATKPPKFKAMWSLRMASGMVVGLTQQERSDEVFKAAIAGNLARLSALVAAGFDSRACNEYGMTALAATAEAGHVGATQWLLDFGVDPHQKFNDGCSTALDAAVQNGHHAAAAALEAAGALRGTCGGETAGTPDWSAGAEALRPTWKCLIPPDDPGPGAGSWYIDGGFTARFLEGLDGLYTRLPVATTAKESCNTRRYHLDLDGSVAAQIERLLASLPFDSGCVRAYRRMRFLDYSREGGALPAHTDLRRTDPRTGIPSSHTFLLYLTTCRDGGETTLLQGPRGEDLASVAPVRGRLLIFPHLCWHEGRATVSVPKRLLRGELG